MPTPNQAIKSMDATLLTVEQKRAADAWRCVRDQSKEYANLAKGLPALIMNSGLLQVMAFLHEKGRKPKQSHCLKLGEQLRGWVNKRFPEVPENFDGFMQALMNADSRKFQSITAECLAWLRWLRQIAPAVIGDGR